MGFLKSLLGRADEEPVSKGLDDFPELYNGMKAEVLTPANALIFVGRLRLMGDDTVEVRAETGGFLPRGVYNQPVKLRAFQRDGTALTLFGAVGPNGLDFWRIEKLQYLQNSEHRSFFRQNTSGEGWVSSLNSSKDQRFPCKVLDISGGGARIVTEKLLDLGGSFQLEAAVLPGETPFTITCQVKRIQVRPKPGGVKQFEYGCQFMELPPREQDRLMQSIFTLQRKMLQSRRES